MLDVPALLSQLWGDITSGNVDVIGRIFRLRIGLLFGCALLYALSPFDLIPEAVFGVLG